MDNFLLLKFCSFNTFYCLLCGSAIILIRSMTFTTLKGKRKFLSYLQGTAHFLWIAVNVVAFSQQVQAPHTGGPSITGHPIPPPGGQPTKSTDKSNKQQPRQIASHFGPPLRYQGGPPGVQDGAKPSAKTGQQGKENKKPLPAGKQAKTNAWRQFPQRCVCCLLYILFREKCKLDLLFYLPIKHQERSVQKSVLFCLDLLTKLALCLSSILALGIIRM